MFILSLLQGWDIHRENKIEFNVMTNYENAHDCWRPKYIETDRFVHEDVDLVVIFGRMDAAKLDLK